MNINIFEYGWVGSFTAVVILYLIYWYQRPSKFPPGPRGIPFLGYLPAYKSLEPTVYKLSKNFGRIMSVRIGVDDVVFLNDYETINKAFLKQGSVFSGRVGSPMLDRVRKGHGIIARDYGSILKAQRTFGLLTFKGFGVGKKRMENICSEESRYLVEEIRKSNEEPRNMSVILHNAVSNVTCNLVLGKRFEYHDKQFTKMLHIIINLFENPANSLCNKLTVLVPFLKYVPPASWITKKMTATMLELYEWLGTIVQEHKETFDPNCPRDFIDAFLAEKKKGKDESFSSHQLMVYIHDLFIAGTETTATTLQWILLCLMHFPEVQKKLRNEIVDVFGHSGKIDYAKRDAMAYTNAFIQEMSRFRTLAPSAVPHKTLEDTNLDGYFIPKNTKVISNLWAVNNDPSLWKEPEKFIPERFINEKGNFVPSNYVVSFGVGRRRCLGEQLARMEVFMFLVAIVQKLEFVPDPDNFPALNVGTPGLVYAPKPFKVVAKECSD